MFIPKTIHSFYRRPKKTALLDWTREADILEPGKLKFLSNRCACARDDVVDATFASWFNGHRKIIMLMNQTKKFYFPEQI